EVIADLENGAQAMWTTKAQAGDIKAGIGLVAKDDGTSQVALSASQVFVFDPNSTTPLAPLLAIDNGQTVIAEAIIRKATIQIIHSEKITADYIKAGVSITTPLINGGQIDMGNAFMAGGAAGFGKGGPYGGWGWGWNTIIYSDGSIYTNKLNAEGGYVKNMTIGNCVIEQDCVVKGTIYAERIFGDVCRSYALGPNSSIEVAAEPYHRRVQVMMNIAGGRGGSGGTSYYTAYLNGAPFAQISASTAAVSTGISSYWLGTSSCGVGTTSIPANTKATLSTGFNHLNGNVAGAVFVITLS
ncbi:DUF1983 domain-containing protein, partial [Aeromonas veronii]